MPFERLKRMHDDPTVVITEEDERRLQNDEVVVKEAEGTRFAFHNGDIGWSGEIAEEHDAEWAPWSNDWGEHTDDVEDGWHMVTCIFERNARFNLP